MDACQRDVCTTSECQPYSSTGWRLHALSQVEHRAVRAAAEEEKKNHLTSCSCYRFYTWGCRINQYGAFFFLLLFGGSGKNSKGKHLRDFTSFEWRVVRASCRRCFERMRSLKYISIWKRTYVWRLEATLHFFFVFRCKHLADNIGNWHFCCSGDFTCVFECAFPTHFKILSFYDRRSFFTIIKFCIDFAWEKKNHMLRVRR